MEMDLHKGSKSHEALHALMPAAWTRSRVVLRARKGRFAGLSKEKSDSCTETASHDLYTCVLTCLDYSID